jgi:transposase
MNEGVSGGRSQAALVASHHNPALKTFADRLRNVGKPHKVVITAVARKLVTIVNALIKAGDKWSPQTP